MTLRALGMAAADFHGLFADETGLLAACGPTIGAIVGAAMATLVAQILAPLFVIPPALPEVAAGGLLLAVVVLAGTAGATGPRTLDLGRLRPVELLREDKGCSRGPAILEAAHRQHKRPWNACVSRSLRRSGPLLAGRCA